MVYKYLILKGFINVLRIEKPPQKGGFNVKKD